MRDNEKIQENSQQSDTAEFRERTIKSTDADLGSRQVLEGVEELVWFPAEVDTSIRPGWFHHEVEDQRVRSLEELISIYLKSVGGNSVLLLNVPPHKDGYITEYDVQRLSGLGDFIRETFRHNAATGAKLSASATETVHRVENILTEDEQYWKSPEGTEQCGLVIELPEAQAIQYVILMEQIRLSQRVERFELWALEPTEETNASEDAAGSESSKASETSGYVRVYCGSTVGYKKICKLDRPVRAKRWKLIFIESRSCPTLKFLGMYA
jgi:alpha-L-fucosidase